MPRHALDPNGAEEGAYDWGCVYAAAYPVFDEDGMRLYYGGSNGPHTNWRDGFLCMAHLRTDGFAGYTPAAAEAPAIITTKAVAFAGKRLRITADIEAGGSVRVAALDEQGTAAVVLEPVTDTASDYRVVWACNDGPAPMTGHLVRLQFTLSKATLYSFSFGN